MMKRALQGVTIIELIVVVMILAILATVAVPVLSGQVTRARIAATQDTIRQLEIAIARYEIDLGEFPPSGSAGAGGTLTLPGSPTAIDGNTAFGNSFLMEALLHSVGGNVAAPSSTRWFGPYLEVDEEQLIQDTGLTGPAERQFQLVDQFGTPFTYTRYIDYVDYSATALPVTDPFAATETFFNPRTVQIWSAGPNLGTSATVTNRGTEVDDINNW